MKRQIPSILPSAESASPMLRKPRSFDAPKPALTTLSRSGTTDARIMTGPIKIPVKTRNAHTVTAPAPPQTFVDQSAAESSLYHIVTPEALSVSPLRPSASMLLLNRAAQVISGSADAVKRMPVATTTQVYSLPKQVIPPGYDEDDVKRQESLLAVFKPATDDEDNLTVHSGTMVQLKISPEDRALRERAAYVLDKAYDGFSKVPATALANIQNSNGSLQEFVSSDGTAEDHPDLIGQASCDEVQKIAILDCRIFNMDRHGGNILVKQVDDDSESPDAPNKSAVEEDSGFFMFGDDDRLAGNEMSFAGGIRLTPIDHSISLPAWTNLGDAWFDWGYYPQANSPLTNGIKEHVLSLDWKKDAERIRELGIKEECVATNSIATIVLRSFVIESPAVTLSMLCDFFQRPYPAEHKLHHIESPLEHLLNEACLEMGVTKDSPPSEKLLGEFERLVREQIRTEAWRSYLV